MIQMAKIGWFFFDSLNMFSIYVHISYMEEKYFFSTIRFFTQENWPIARLNSCTRPLYLKVFWRRERERERESACACFCVLVRGVTKVESSNFSNFQEQKYSRLIQKVMYVVKE